MNKEELIEKQRRVKFCMRRRVPVQYGEKGKYYVEAMLLRYSNQFGFTYSVELSDVKRINSTITVGIDDLDFPKEGGGFSLD